MIPSLQGKSPIYLPVNQCQRSSPIPFLVSPNVAPLPLSHWPHTLGRRPFWHQKLLGLSQGHSSGSLSCLLLLALRRPRQCALLLPGDQHKAVPQRALDDSALAQPFSLTKQFKSFNQGTTVHSSYSAGPLASFWMFSSKGHRWLDQGTHYTVRRSLVVPQLR